ncbi:hypothetical protein RQP46_000850 [Phenoliferia psychrophenolica]
MALPPSRLANTRPTNPSTTSTTTTTTSRLVPAKRSVSPASSSTLSATPTLELPPDGAGEHPPSDENLNPYEAAGRGKAKKPRLSDDSGYGEAPPREEAVPDDEADLQIPDSVDGDAQADDLAGLGGSWRDDEALEPVAVPLPPPTGVEALNASLLGFQAKQINILDQIVEVMSAGPGGQSAEGNDLGYLQHNLTYVRQRVAALQEEIARKMLDPSPRQISPAVPGSAPRPPVVQARQPRSDSVPSSTSAHDEPARVVPPPPPVQARPPLVASTSRQQLPSAPAQPAVSAHFANRAAPAFSPATTSAAKPFSAPRVPPPEPRAAPSNAKGKGRAEPVPEAVVPDITDLLDGIDFDVIDEDEDEEMREPPPPPPPQQRRPQPQPQPQPQQRPPPPRPKVTVLEVDDDDDEDDEPIVVSSRRNPPPPAAAQRAPPPPAQRQVVMIEPKDLASGSAPSNGRAPGLAVVLPPKGGHPWSHDVAKALKQRFGLVGFRTNQEKAVNATLSGRDVFVLLPTGGGKSLCFQLPAVVQSGTTHGVTIVISPLLSLISDQCQALYDKDIPAVFINGSMSKADKDHAIGTLRTYPAPSCLLAYVTPEQIVKSDFFRSILRQLYDRNQLARFVLDEAHCVSSWGHDFRPDYKQMGLLKQDFPGVPIMALTATASERVKHDIISNLGMERALVLTASFNRPNLKYEVRPKTKGFLSDIIEFVQQRRKECGIIYCASQRLCEETAQKLRNDANVEARHYHAGMAPADRLRIQKGWQDDVFPVICATIAFGMGIDKPGVRYVIHYAMPQSLESYYQETGRAGRDGESSVCILYYAFHDTQLLYRLIDDGDATPAQKENNKDNVRRVVQYCINEADCRRMQVLAYFGETFDPRDCHKTCDNCATPGGGKPKSDLSDVAKDAVGLVRSIEDDKVTMIYAVDVFYGSKTAKIKAAGHDQNEYAGKGSSYQRGDVERLFQLLAAEGAFAEKIVGNKAGFTNAYIKLGKKANEVSQGRKRILMALSNETGKKKGAPAQPQRRADPNADFADDDEIEDESSNWNPTARKPAKAKAKEKGADPNQECLENLRKARAKAAKAKGVPPESLLDDATLQSISLILPQSEQEFLAMEDATAQGWQEFKAMKGRDLTRQCADKLEEGPAPGPSAPKPSKPAPAKVTRPAKATTAAATAALARNAPKAKSPASDLRKYMAPVTAKKKVGGISAMPIRKKKL